MLQLVYISTSRAAIDDALLESVLATSRRHNAAADISGLLLVGGRRFLQALEGPAHLVEQTYARIKADARHFAFVELGRRTVDEAEFGPWSMATIRARDIAGGKAIRAAAERLTASVPDPNVRALFTGFAEFHSQAA